MPSPVVVIVKLAVEVAEAAVTVDKGVSDAAEAAKARETKASSLEEHNICACRRRSVNR